MEEKEKIIELGKLAYKLISIAGRIRTIAETFEDKRPEAYINSGMMQFDFLSMWLANMMLGMMGKAEIDSVIKQAKVDANE